MLPIEHVWDMEGRQLVRSAPPATNVDALWTLLQTAWQCVHQQRIRALFDSMPRRLEALIAACGGFIAYRILPVRVHV